MGFCLVIYDSLHTTGSGVVLLLPLLLTEVFACSESVSGLKN